jgi:hypothetical protein
MGTLMAEILIFTVLDKGKNEDWQKELPFWLIGIQFCLLY